MAEIASNFKVSSLEEMNNIVNQLKKAFIENALNEEMTEYLGYEKWDQNSRTKSSNYRNGYSKKSVKTHNGLLELSIPRDEESLFEPKIVKKYQNDISGFDEKIILMYAKGMSTRDINEYIYDIYGIEVSKDFISKVTDKILPDIMAWQSRPLDKTYAVVFVDGIRFKVKEENSFKERKISLYSHRN